MKTFVLASNIENKTTCLIFFRHKDGESRDKARNKLKLHQKIEARKKRKLEALQNSEVSNSVSSIGEVIYRFDTQYYGPSHLYKKDALSEFV